MRGLTKVLYKNVSGVAIPPFGIMQLTGACVVTAAGDIVVQATSAGNGSGPYMIDDGGGSGTIAEAVYGTCSRAVDGFAWVAYGCTAPPTQPWHEVGPILGGFIVSTQGEGYYYAGQYDSDNSRILVMMSTFDPVATNCTASSSSNSASSRSSGSGSSSSVGSSGSGSSSGPCGCITVATNVSCSGGSLSVTYGSARGCC